METNLSTNVRSPLHERTTLRVPKAAVIFRQNDQGDDMFLIIEGRVRLYVGADGFEKDVAVLGPGEFFGELSLLDTRRRTATAEAVEDALLLPIPRDAFALLVQDDVRVVLHMLVVMSQRLRQADDPTFVGLLQQLAQARILAHCLRRAWQAERTHPVSLHADDVSGALGLGGPIVESALAALARRGAGTLLAREWRLQGTEELCRLVDALCEGTEVRRAGDSPVRFDSASRPL